MPDKPTMPKATLKGGGLVNVKITGGTTSSATTNATPKFEDPYERGKRDGWNEAIEHIAPRFGTVIAYRLRAMKKD